MKEGKEVNVLGIEMLNRRLLFANVENRCRIKAMCSLWTSTVRLLLPSPEGKAAPGQDTVSAQSTKYLALNKQWTMAWSV